METTTKKIAKVNECKFTKLVKSTPTHASIVTLIMKETTRFEIFILSLIY